MSLFVRTALFQRTTWSFQAAVEWLGKRSAKLNLRRVVNYGKTRRYLFFKYQYPIKHAGSLRLSHPEKGVTFLEGRK